MSANEEQTPYPETSIRFLYPETNDENFGIYNFKLPEHAQPIFKNVNWIITTDISGSMSNICSDEKSKMQQIKYALQKMIKYFYSLSVNNNIEQTITLIIFDNETTVISDREEINEKYIIKFNEELIHKFVPNNTTDIGNALDTAADFTSLSHTNQLRPQKTIHIFLTDGQITCGVKNHNMLKQKVITDNNVSNIFMGFGTQHSDTLLEALASTPNSEYYFIESLEKAGMVYGEVVYNSLYESINNLVLNIKNGELYDHTINSWVKTLKIGNLPFSANKTWHLRTSNKNQEENPMWSNCKIMASYDLVIQPGVSCDKPTNTATYPNPDTIDKKVEKYHWRQRTQELISETRTHIQNNKDNYNSYISDDYNRYNSQSCDMYEEPIDDDLFALPPPPPPPPQDPQAPQTPAAPQAPQTPAAALQQRLDKFLENLKIYIKENNLEDDAFMKNLCDDIYVCIKGINSPLGYMYVTARESSQGYQRAYNITDYEELVDINTDNTNYYTASIQGYETSQNHTTSYASSTTSQVIHDLSS